MGDEESEGESEGGRAGGASAQALTPTDRFMTGLWFSMNGAVQATARFPTAELAERFKLSMVESSEDWSGMAKDLGGAALLLVRNFPYNVSVWLDVELGRFLLFDGKEFVPPSYPLYSDAEKAALSLIEAREEPATPSSDCTAGNDAQGSAGRLG